MAEHDDTEDKTGMDTVLAALAQELRRGTTVLCVLSQLDEPKYGYSLVATLAQGGVPVETNTLYPLLRRLEAQKLLSSQWETSESKPRKYYEITEEGRQVYLALKEKWIQTTASMEKLLGL